MGLRDGDALRFRYARVTADGEIATGRSTDEIERLDDGRTRTHGSWPWDSKAGSGTGVLETVGP